MYKYVAIATLGLAGSIAQAADIAKGKQIADTRCVSCHGKAGISANPLYPNLAGQKAAYMAKQLKDFESGKRSDPVMNAMVKGMSSADFESLAAYYASLK